MSCKLKYQRNYINMRYYINLQISICIFIINIGYYTLYLLYFIILNLNNV